MLTTDSPEAVGLDPKRWQYALDLAESWCSEDKIPAIGLVVGKGGKTTRVHLFGRHRMAPNSEPVREDAIFLIASITKPIIATGILLLVERSQLALGDRVKEYIPEFGGTGKYGITVRNLLTHTSGLPDMLPNNFELRKSHEPLSAFVEGTCKAATDFPPGRGVKYQSMGFCLLGEIIQRVSGKLCARFMQDEFFTPLEMHDTQLGAPNEWFEGETPTAARITEIRLPEAQSADEDWNWNNRYWRSLGAPWGGLLTTPADLAKFAQMMLNRGTYNGVRVLSKASIEVATRNQLQHMPDVPEVERRCRPWGWGWRLNWPAHSANFGDLLGPTTYGHWGSTGTVMWMDPSQQAFAVVLSTQPQEPHGRYLSLLSNAIAAAIV
jgi:CubicO group peptidase (beta-lactamase class C family)